MVYRPPSTLEFPHLRVERVAQAVAEEVEREERQRHRHAGEDELPREDRDVLDALLREAPPRGVGRLNAEAEEREERLLQHHRRDGQRRVDDDRPQGVRDEVAEDDLRRRDAGRSEEHTSELQSLAYLVCRLLLEKK